MVIREVAPTRVEYEQRRNNNRVVNWLKDSMATALADGSSCRSLGFESFVVDRGEFEGCSSYHAFYPLACEIFPQGPMQHFDWWVEKMRSTVKDVDRKPVVWIPATATPVMVEIAEEALGREADYIVSDLCGTPLRVIKKAFDKSVHTYKSDIFKPNYDLWRGFLHGGIDIIATDAFITRFDQQALVSIMKTFKSALRKGGHLLTTVRHPKAGESSASNLLENNSSTAGYPDRVIAAWGQYVSKHPNADNIVDSEFLRKLAQYYAENMKSRHGKAEELENLFEEARLSLSVLHDVDLPEGQGYAINTLVGLLGGLKVVDCQISQECVDITPRQYQLWDFVNPD